MPNGSVSGCYFMPLSFWCRTKICPSSARIISLTPPGHSTCEVICIIVDDLIEGIVNGITAINPEGEEVFVFLDLVCLIADYPAVSPVIDTRGHMANAPCTVCTFTRQKDAFDSDYGYMSNAIGKHAFCKILRENYNITKCRNYRSRHVITGDEIVQNYRLGGCSIIRFSKNAFEV